MASKKYEKPNEQNYNISSMHLTNRGPNLGNYYAKPCWLEKDFLGFQGLNDLYKYIFET